MEEQKALFKRFIRNECTRQEIEDLLSRFTHAGNEIALREIILEALKNEEENIPQAYPDLEEKERVIYAALAPHLTARRTFRLWPRIAAAASILLVLSAGGYFILHKKQVNPSVTIAKNDINPGSNRATLTLANGQKIILTKGLNGKLAQQGHTLVQVNNGNAIAYTVSPTTTNEAIAYNTLSTVRGEQSPYPLILADGSKVWLNAQSSITFPTAFNGKERLVKITGEAYFEVVHNDSQPFKVEFNGQTVQDIGTHFNINAYTDEPLIRTTVLEGSVKITKGDASAIISPGQQAQSHMGNMKIEVKEADVDGTMAWRNGFSHFDHADIPTVMRTLSRWYNVQVVYDGTIPKREFSGDIPRSFKASQALDVLALLKIDFRIDGQKIIVTNKK